MVIGMSGLTGLAVPHPPKRPRIDKSVLAFPVRKPGRIDKSSLAQPIPERERSGPYLDFVRRQACCVPECRSGMEVEAHHPIGGRGGKVLSSDFLAVPICTAHHTGANDALHRMGSERKWCEKHGVDLAYVQADLQRRWKAIKGGKQ